MHIEPRLPRNALYTALSRAKTASGLFIVGNLKLTNEISEKDQVLRELKRLKQHCSIIWSILLTSPTVYIHNVRTLSIHWEALIVDPVIFHSKVLVLQETMTLSTDCFNIPGYTLIGRIDGNARVSGSGTHIYSRNPALCKFISSHSSCHIGGRIEIMKIKFYDPVIMDKPVVVMSTYQSPRSSMEELYSNRYHFMSKSDNSDHLIVAGDCDVNLFARSSERDTLLKYYSNSDLQQILSGVSTKYGSQQDCVFTKNINC